MCKILLFDRYVKDDAKCSKGRLEWIYSRMFVDAYITHVRVYA